MSEAGHLSKVALAIADVTSAGLKMHFLGFVSTGTVRMGRYPLQV